MTPKQKAKRKKELELLKKQKLDKERILREQIDSLVLFGTPRSKLKSVTDKPVEKFRRKTELYPSVDPMERSGVKVNKIELSEDMLVRERIALKKAEKLKTQVAPAFNKGAYQLISKLDIQFLGKKV